MKALPNEILFVQQMTREFAETIYLDRYWRPFHFDQFDSQELADKAFDLTVNMGPGSMKRPGSITLLQKSINKLSTTAETPIKIDGLIGAETLALINALDPVKLLIAYRGAADARYRAIALANPELTSSLGPWLRRLAA